MRGGRARGHAACCSRDPGGGPTLAEPEPTVRELAARIAALEKEKRIADALVQVAEQTGDTLALPVVLDRFCRAAVELVPADRCAIYLFSERRRAYIPVADCGTPPEVLRRFAERYYYPGTFRYEETLAAGEIVAFSRDTTRDPGVLAALEEVGVYALVIAPLRGRARTLGSMSVGLHGPPGFDESGLRVLRGVARQAASLIENAQLFMRVDKAAALRAKLGQLAAALSAEVDPAAIGARVCADGAALFGVSGGVVLVREGDFLVPCGLEAARAADARDLRVPLADTARPSVQAFLAGRPLFVNDVPGEGGPTHARHPELKCFLAIPLVGRDGPIGCLVYADLVRTHRFTPEIADEGALLGAIAAAALERASLVRDLRSSEEHFRALIERARDMITIVDRGGTIRYASPSVATVLGVPAQEVVGRRAVDVVHPDDAPALGRLLEDAGPGRTAPAPVELRMRHADGSWRTLESVGNDLPAAARVRGTVLASRDVTERKHAERRVAAQHDAACVLVESPTLADAVPRVLRVVCETLGWDVGTMWVLDREAGVLRCAETWSDAAHGRRFVARSRSATFAPGEGLPGRVWTTGDPVWIADVGRDGNFPRAAEASADGLHTGFAFPIRTRAGVLGVVEFFKRRAEAPDAALLRLLGVIGHQLGLFLERKEAEEALRESEERARLIVETAYDALVTMDADGIVRGWNRQAERTFGWTREEAIGRRLSTLIVPERFRAAHERGLAHFLATGEAPVLNTRIEIAALHRDGHEIPVELAVWPMRTRAGQAFGAFVHDITERRRQTAALEEARARAEAQARQLRAQTEELVHARDEALASTRAKSEFLANMSHEIRTPMNGVIGMTELLLDTALSDEQRGYALAVRSSAESLLGIINDILDFSKIEAGKLTTEVIDFDLRVAMEEVAGLLAARAQEKGLELTCDVPPDFCARLRGDPGRIRQVLTNLVGNAVKFTEAGEVVLAVRTLYETARYATVRLWVRDTGIGVPPDRREAIFESFTQADGSSTRKYGGTGLGLAICRQLVALMGGRIGLDSEPGRGSTFWVELSLEKQTADGAPQGRAPGQLGGLRMLVVDDNATNRTFLTKQLASWGVEAVAAASGAEALRILRAAARERPFRCVLLDMQMPEIDGAQTAEAIRADPRLATVPLVVLSSIGAQHLGDLRAKGIAASLTKPVRQSQLLDTLLEVVGTPPADERPATDAAAAGERRLGLRVLVAEDNPINQNVAVGMVERWGCRADAVANGREALAALERARYDVVLMDVQMPEMDGFEATAAIRRREGDGLARLPIIAMTAHAMAGDRERCLAADMDDYVAKPLRAAELHRALARWSGHTAPAEAAVTPRAAEDAAPVFDVAQLHESTGADAALEAAILDDFLAQLPTLVDALRDALAAADPRRLGATAHSLRGSCYAVGAMALGRACGTLEELARSRDLDAARATLAAAERELGRLRAALRRHVGRAADRE
ncbi:MAG TPA: PAS domain S-box protein [Candidatus Binatia bacterium]|nr:PAS domain S-box protein [Candidatus Binatia bacterium]